MMENVTIEELFHKAYPDVMTQITTVRVISRDRRMNFHGLFTLSIEQAFGTTWKCGWKVNLVDMKSSLSPTELTTLKPSANATAFRFLFYITPFVMFLFIAQKTGVTLGELHQAFIDEDLVKMLKNRLSAKLINDYVLCGYYIAFCVKVLQLD